MGQDRSNVPSNEIAEEQPKKSHFGFLKRRKKDDNANVVGANDGEETKVKKHFGLWPQLKVTVFGSWINILLVCVPVGIALHCEFCCVRHTDSKLIMFSHFRQSHCDLCHQLSCHHPAGGNAELCDRGNCTTCG